MKRHFLVDFEYSVAGCSFINYGIQIFPNVIVTGPLIIVRLATVTMIMCVTKIGNLNTKTIYDR